MAGIKWEASVDGGCGKAEKRFVVCSLFDPALLEDWASGGACLGAVHGYVSPAPPYAAEP